MASQNSAFGPKTVTLSADGLWGVDQQIQVRVFYPADAANHPDDGTLGANRGTYCGSNEAKSPNWYYYWNQPEAGASFGSPRFCANGWCWGLSHTVCESAPNPPWVAHVHYDARLRETVPGMPSSWPLDWRQKRKGIDYFALIARHEGKHVQLWTAWGATHPNRDNPSVPSDGDIDGLPDSLETPPEYAPADVDGNDDGVPDGHEYIFRNQEWPTRHAYDGNDWSNIGCTYNGQHYTTD